MKFDVIAAVRKFVLALGCLAPLVFWQSCYAEGARAPKPFNRVVIGVDTSGSYKNRAAEAIAKAKGLLDGMAKRRVRRWEASDQVVVISIDAIPEVVWEGTTKDLAVLDPATWTERFQGRADYSGCTDVERFFALSASKLSADPAPAEKYLVAFSDLKAEPPLDSPRKCSRPIPAAKIVKAVDWDQFSDVSVLVFWMPVSLKHAYLKALADQGIRSGIKLYSESESGIQSLEAPKEAKRKPNDAEREQVKEQLISAGSSIALVLGYGIALLIAGALVALAVGLLVRWRRGGNGALPAHANVRVPPLVLPQTVRPAEPRPVQPNPANRGGL